MAAVAFRSVPPQTSPEPVLRVVSEVPSTCAEAWDPPALPALRLYRLSVEQYHRMVQTGVITSEDHVELLEGLLVAMNGQNPPHGLSTAALNKRLIRVLSDDWTVRPQLPIALDISVPEPDIVVARGNERLYGDRHPGPADIGLVTETSDSTLERDHAYKLVLYARNHIPIYWIINIPEERIEVYTDPTGPARLPAYRQRKDYGKDDLIPVVIDGVEYAQFAVRELLP